MRFVDGWLAGVATAALLSGCGGNFSVIGSDGNDGGARSDSGGSSDSGAGQDSGGGTSDGGTGEGGGTGPACPVSPPPLGGACLTLGLECEYGSDPNPACDQLVQCTSSGWQSAGGPTTCTGGTCPATYAQVPVGQSCVPTNLTCDYPEGTCICSLGTGPIGTSPHWICWPATSGCPSPRPRIGSPCGQPGLSCDYGACAGGVELECKDGTWQQALTPCPV